ncbi:Glucose-methanol-choline oxidoreductase [Pandoravirus dulcis]|uniref:Glucose-methanol-choline oxidoreductase n=1 Tax=Pandoravirus dulcis TaxID=1349409 RepID=S4VVS7_9VIRU|nr:Glucose-methanol-choline oxidoreductase [Pandoravirus dulcis]AGO82206.1 Glucose-methanol-choline oxidoreductase [Pandoravirus dulcis]
MGRRGGPDPSWTCRRCARRSHHAGPLYAPATTSAERDDHQVHHGHANGGGGSDDDNGGAAVFDYIVVGLGAAGSACARALSDDPSVSVLALDWGPDRRADPTATDLLRGADAAHDPGTSIRVGGAAEPGLLGARCALGGGRAVGGSTLVDSALWGTGGTREWRDFAKACARAGPRHAGAGVWLRRVAAAASIPLARVEAYDGPRDAPVGGAPSSSSAATSATACGLPSACRRRPWDPGGGRDWAFGGAGRDMEHGQFSDRRGGAGRHLRHHDDNGSVAWDNGGHYDDRRPYRAGKDGPYHDDVAQEDDGGGSDGDDDVPDCPVRGTRGRVAVRALPPAWDALSDSFARAAGRVYGVREVADHNGPAEFGVARRVQFAVGLGPPHGFNRQPAGDAFVGHDAERDRCASCRRRRRLTVVGGALVERVVFGSVPPGAPADDRETRPCALGVVYLERGTRAVRAHARRRVVLCASALTSALLQRSGIGDPRLIAGIGTRLVFANAAVGSGYHCPYGFRMVASVVAQDAATTTATSATAAPPGLARGAPDVRSDLNPPGTVGMVLAQDSTRPARRRRQWCVLAAAGPLPDYWPVAGDPLVRAASRWEPFGAPPPPPISLHDAASPRAGASVTVLSDAVISLSAWLLDPTSRGGGIETPSADPSVLPRARLGLYTDPADMRSMRALARSVARLVDTMAPTPDGYRLALAHPAPEIVADDALLDLWLRTEAFYVAHRHGGVCRVGAPPVAGGGGRDAGVVDGLLRVHGVDGLSVCDSTVFDHGMGPGTAAGTAAILGTAYADMLLDGIVDRATAAAAAPVSRRDASHHRGPPRRRAHDPPQQRPPPPPPRHVPFGRQQQPPCRQVPYAQEGQRVTQQQPPPPSRGQPPDGVRARGAPLFVQIVPAQPQRQRHHEQRQQQGAPARSRRRDEAAPAPRQVPAPLERRNGEQIPPARSTFSFVTAAARDDAAAPPALQRRRHR